MNPEKQRRKLAKLFTRAEEAVSRESAQKILKKAKKVFLKIQGNK